MTLADILETYFHFRTNFVLEPTQLIRKSSKTFQRVLKYYFSLELRKICQTLVRYIQSVKVEDSIHEVLWYYKHYGKCHAQKLRCTKCRIPARKANMQGYKT